MDQSHTKNPHRRVAGMTTALPSRQATSAKVTSPGPRIGRRTINRVVPLVMRRNASICHFCFTRITVSFWRLQGLAGMAAAYHAGIVQGESVLRSRHGLHPVLQGCHWYLALGARMFPAIGGLLRCQPVLPILTADPSITRCSLPSHDGLELLQPLAE